MFIGTLLITCKRFEINLRSGFQKVLIEKGRDWISDEVRISEFSSTRQKSLTTEGWILEVKSKKLIVSLMERVVT